MPVTGRVGGLAPVKFLALSPPLSPQLRRRQNELARENHKQLEWEGVLGPSLLDTADTVRLRHSPQADSPSRTSSRFFSPLPRSFPRQNAARCSPARGGLCVAEQNPVRCSGSLRGAVTGRLPVEPVCQTRGAARTVTPRTSRPGHHSWIVRSRCRVRQFVESAQ